MLNGGSFPSAAAETIDEAQVEIDAMNANEAELSTRVNGFIPLRPLHRLSNGRWVLWCPNLDVKTGRCNDYDNRPVLCEIYKPGSDRICVVSTDHQANYDGIC